jgi:hypothetical protein
VYCDRSLLVRAHRGDDYTIALIITFTVNVPLNNQLATATTHNEAAAPSTSRCAGFAGTTYERSVPQRLRLPHLGTRATRTSQPPQYVVTDNIAATRDERPQLPPIQRSFRTAFGEPVYPDTPSQLLPKLVDQYLSGAGPVRGSG